MYTEDLVDKFFVFIIRKLEDGRGCLWTVKIPIKVIRNIIKAYKAPEVKMNVQEEEERISTSTSISMVSISD